MKDLRIFLSILCLFSLYAISNTTSASGEDEGHKFGFVSIVHAVPTEYEGEVEYSRISKKKEVKKVASKIKVAPKTKKLPAPVPKTPTVPTPPKQTPITPAPTSSITKSATVTYQSPGGVDTVTFSVTANR